MKKIAIIASIGLTFAAAGTLTAGLISSNKAGLDSEVKAEIVASGTTIISTYQSSAWREANAKFAVHYWNSQTDGWSEFSLDTGKNYVYTVSYSLDFVPTGMQLCRFDPNDNTKHTDNNWGNSGDLPFAEVLCVAGSIGSSQWTDNLATVKGLASDIKLDSYKEGWDESNYGESYKTGISLNAGDTFTIEHSGNTYHTPRVESHIASNFTTEDNKIKCLVSGTYDLFFNTSDSHKYGRQLWIETSAENAATAFANNFLTNFTCGGETGPDAGTVTAEEGTWGNLKIAWNVLTDGSKSYFLNVKDNPSETGTVYQQVMARYKYVIEKYGTDVYEDFMGAGYTKKLSSNAINLVENNGNNYTAIIIIAASVAVVSLSAAFIMLKKRKESK